MDRKQLLGLAGALIAAIAVEFNGEVVSTALPDIKGGLGISKDPGTWLLLTLRFLQGSGEFIILLLLATGLRVLTPKTRLYALAAYALTATFAPNVSPMLAALWVDPVNWRFVFFEDLPLFAVAFLLVWYGLPQDEPQYARLKKFDWRGGILIIIAAFSFITLLEQGNRLDWFNSVPDEIFGRPARGFSGRRRRRHAGFSRHRTRGVTN